MSNHDLTQYDRYIYDELTPCPSEHGKYQCPVCGSGSRPGGTGALSVHVERDGRTRFKCFSCNASGDIFDLFALRDGLSQSDATRAVMEKYGSGYPGMTPLQRAQAAFSDEAKPAQAKPSSVKSDFLQDIKRFHAAIPGSDGERYLYGRGISAESIRRFQLGYDATQRKIIIPHNPEGSYCTGRFIDPVPKPHKNPPGVSIPLFNPDALFGDAPCFIVESNLCAISIEQMGGKAVALCGTQGFSRLQDQIKTRRPTAPALLVAMDNDEPGQKAAQEIIEKLREMGFTALQVNIAGECKDPNELLQKDSQALRANIAAVLSGIEEQIAAEKQVELNEYLASSTANFMDEFEGGITESVSTPAIPTGFTSLDTKLDGGLYEGLYFIGAISSLGKTTFVQQIGDQIARSGEDVLYFSLEMSRFELIAKSISRLTYSLSKQRKQNASIAKTTRGVLAGKLYASYNADELCAINDAQVDYKTHVAPRLWIQEGVGDIGVEQIREAVERHIRITGRRPVVIIDYLQIIAPADPRASDKQNTDKAVLELKRLSRDTKIPILAISSLNRENYSAPISMTAFKESGAIEYSSDVLLGLQYEGMDYRDGESDKARDQRIRELRKANDEKASKGEGIEIELKILKNRNGSKGRSDPFLFTPKYNTYTEAVCGFFPDDSEDNPFKAGINKRRVL